MRPDSNQSADGVFFPLRSHPIRLMVRLTNIQYCIMRPAEPRIPGKV